MDIKNKGCRPVKSALRSVSRLYIARSECQKKSAGQEKDNKNRSYSSFEVTDESDDNLTDASEDNETDTLVNQENNEKILNDLSIVKTAELKVEHRSLNWNINQTGRLEETESIVNQSNNEIFLEAPVKIASGYELSIQHESLISKNKGGDFTPSNSELTHSLCDEYSPEEHVFPEVEESSERDRDISPVVPPRAADLGKEGHSQQLCQRPLHHRQGTDQLGAGPLHESGRSVHVSPRPSRLPQVMQRNQFQINFPADGEIVFGLREGVLLHV